VTRAGRVARRAGARAVSVVRHPDPAVLVAAVASVGVAWALQLPLGIAVGVGGAWVLGSAVVKAWLTVGTEPLGAGPTPRPGTDQAVRLAKLRWAADQLADMVPTFAGSALGSPAVEAAAGASAAVDWARRLAAATDAIDDELYGLTPPISRRRLKRSAKARATSRAAATRLEEHREELISRIEAAYIAAADVRVKLLEVSAAMQTSAGDAEVNAGLAAVADNLGVLREGLQGLESAAAKPLPRPASESSR
jgi:hypothetical protein